MQEINPVNYQIHLIPDLINFSFAGTTKIQFEAKNPIDEITVNILELAIWNCKVTADDLVVECPFLVNTKNEELRILLPKAMSGRIMVTIDYQGHINNKMVGFYRSTYIRGEETRYIAVTQFEESDARRAFPCMDHPARKATFDVKIDVDPHLVAISNSTVKEKRQLENRKKRVVFEQTPKMSTYLLFFGIGEFEFTQDSTDPRVRVVTLPGMKKYAQFGLEFTRKSLAYSEAYYGVSYPLSKLDMIAIPDFAYGAMENWGAITFRENLLLHYPDITSKAGEERICEVIAHEIAHQWFGNLVTPSDWKYLWLNESFATYFGFGVVDHYYPQWDTWEQFLQSQTGTAMARDALGETFAIEIPGGEHIVINASTAPIIYNKGSSILRQIQGYIGNQNFKKGLQHYLKTYEYECAASHHLWESFETVSNQPIRLMMKSWIEQPGFPMVGVRREGNELILSQKRFTFLPNKFDQTWIIPLTIKLFTDREDSQELTVLLDEAEKTIEIEENTIAYKVNHQQTGFYRVKYADSNNLAELGKRVKNRNLPPEDRWGLQNDLFALVRSGDTSLNDYLRFLAYYENEDSYLPLTSIATNLFTAYLIMDQNQKANISSLAKTWFETILSKIGFEPAAGEKHTTSILREQLIWEAAICGSTKTIQFANKKFSSLMQNASVHADIMKSVMQVGALNGNMQVFTWLDEKFQSSQIEHERMNILIALGCFQNPELIKKAQNYVLEKVPARNTFIPVVAMASNPFAIPLMWDWYVSNLARIEKFHPMLYERVVAAIIPIAGLQRADEVKAFFEDYMKKTSKAADVIKLSLERLEINLRIRAAN
ncbi:MAG: M1 family metallopeptidase [Desulfobacterales bacterium]|jgi:tricorn protease interacting factor F2/3